MTDGLYLRDAYLTHFDAVVGSSSPDGIVLDRTLFYPTGGGQPSDLGTLMSAEGARWAVTGVEKSAAGIVHRGNFDPGPSAGSPVQGEIDWPRRYAHMRYHTALHILSGVVFHRFGSGITGGQIYGDRARMDFSLPDFDRALADQLVEGANAIVAKDLPIEVRFIDRQSAQADASLVRVAAQLMPDVEELRLIDISGFDVQADGGTHVRSTAEVGPLSLERIENKGSRHKRMYVRVEERPAGSPRAPD
jgi:misacylated tRNA(Ala) deacylase